MVLDSGEIQQITDPVTLYQEPSNLFVAKFIGSPIINTFKKESNALNPVSSLKEEEWQTLGIRSEHFILADETNYLIRSIIQRVETVGKDVTIHCEWEGESFVASDLVTDLAEGDTLYLSVPYERLLFFDNASQRLELPASAAY